MKNTLKRAISLLIAITILALANVQGVTATSTTTFTDVKTTDWHYNYVNKLVELKITAGIGNNKYGPNNSVTRAEFVTFLCKTLGHAQTQGDPFVDTQKHWSTGYVTIALANGIMDLPTDKKFRPDAAITRQEAVEMMCRALNILMDSTTKNPYTDVKTVNAGYTNAAYANYLMQGSITQDKRYFKPMDKLTRGEVAAVIVNAYDYNTDKMGYLNKKIAEMAAIEKAEKEKAEQEKEKAQTYQQWLAGMDKGVNKALLTNTTLLSTKGTLHELNKQVLKDLENGEWDNWLHEDWADRVGLTPENFADEFVRVGRETVEAWINADYRKIDILKNRWQSVMSKNFLKGKYQSNINNVINNQWVRQGYFYTGKSLLVYNSVGQPELRGTIKYRWVSPSKLSGTDKLDVWYEEEIALDFFPESTGIKSNSGWNQISATKTVK